MNLMSNISKKIIAPFFILIIIVTGCKKDFLDTKSDTALTKSQIDSNYLSIFNFAIAPYVFLNDYIGILDANPLSNGFNAIDGNLFAVCTDEAVQTIPSLYGANLFALGTFSPYNNPADVYRTCYTGIRSVNYFLENYFNIEDPVKYYKKFLAFHRDTISDDGESYKRDIEDIEFYKAEARVLRAYYYYELIKRYGGVPLVTKTLPVDQKALIPRTEFGKIVEFIVSEIDLVKNDLQANWNEFDNEKKGRISKSIALTIKLKALILDASPLHNPNNEPERWQKAASAANEIIELKMFSLDPNYGDMFISNNTISSVESIWEIRLNRTNDFERRNYPINTKGGNNEITPCQNLVDAYEYKTAADPKNTYANRDPRFGFSIVYNNSKWNNRKIQMWKGGSDDYTKANVSRTGYYLKKFLNDNLDLVKDAKNQRSWIIFRYADVLLNYAEAMNEAYGPDVNNGYSMTARDAVDMVRSRPGVEMPKVVAANKEEMREKIKHERRIELAFEGQRYWDLLRWKDAEVALNTTIKGVIPTMNSDSTFNYAVHDVEPRVFAAPKMYLFPIPWNEIYISDGVLTQNPGW
jgi:hypothetical protein